MIKRFIIALIFIILICGGLVGFNLFRDKAISDYFANMQTPSQTVSTYVIEPGDWEPGIDAIGTVSARQGVDLAVEANGTVMAINFKANQDVTKDAVLVQIDDRIERADLASSESSLQLAEDTLRRTRSLASRGVNAASALDTAQSEAIQARSTVERLRAVLRQKSLEAPFAGTMGIPEIEVGQYVTAGTKVATLQSLDTMRVDFTVPEQELSSLKLGQPIKVMIGEGEDGVDGTITGIDPKINAESRLVSVRGEVENPDRKLNPGQFVRVRVVLPTDEGVLAVPQTAVTSSLYGDYVFVVRNKREGQQNGSADAQPEQAQVEPIADDAENLEVRQVFVQLGRRSGQRVEIREGLRAGETVVTAGQNRLSNATPVTINNDVNPAEIERSGAQQ
ncbi:efflux RND transporter periplasmic adaptor subunit [Limoniibacter endophyticus]|nr:efflux RND transporter periplasmic adaptor subunit [Limoniibacter endophyticus]